jgi:uncharacterized protein YdeI (YjbR/CyaY-like superfamily)
MKSKSTNVIDLIAAMEPWVEELMLPGKCYCPPGLKEEIKWGGPIYTLNGKNVLAIEALRFFS